MSETAAALSTLQNMVMGTRQSPAAALDVALAELARICGGHRAWLFAAQDCASTGAVGLRHLPGEGAAKEAADLAKAIPTLLAKGGHEPSAGPIFIDASEGFDAGAFGGMTSCLLQPIVKGKTLAGVLLIEAEAAPDGLDLSSLAAQLLELRLLQEGPPLAPNTGFGGAAHVSAEAERLDLLLEVNHEARFTGFCYGAPGLLIAPVATLRGLTLADVLPPDVNALVMRSFKTAWEKGTAESVNYTLDVADGRRHFKLRADRQTPLDSNGAPTVMFAISDITNLRQLDSEIFRLRHIVQAMSNLVVLLDTEKRVVWANPAFERRSGWSNVEIYQRDLASLVRNEQSSPEVAAALDAALAEDRAFSGQNINFDRFGNPYWIEFNVVPLYRLDGTLEGYATIETDVSALKAQEARAEASAREAAEARARLEHAVDAIPDAALIFDADQRLVASNPAFARVFPDFVSALRPGAKVTDLLLAGLANSFCGLEANSSEGEAWLADQKAKLLQDAFVEETELRDGRWLRRVQSRTGDGGMIVIWIDVTSRRRHIAALDAMNQELIAVLRERDEVRRRMVSIMMGAQVGTWELDLSKGEIIIGGHWADILGRAASLGKVITVEEFRALVHPDDIRYLHDVSIYHSEFGAKPFEFELRMLHQAGHWVWIMSRGQVIRRDEAGMPLNLVGVHLDISERKRLEREIAASEAHLSTAMDSSVAAIALMDHSGQIVYSNAEARRILGFVPGMFSGNRDGQGPWVLERLDGTPLPDDELPFVQALRQGKSMRDLKLAARFGDGSRRVLVCNAAPIDAGEGRINVVISFWDITEQLRATEELKAALAHAEDMSQAKSRFLANMSHEIRTPLNGVLGLSEVLEMQLKDPSHRSLVASIRNSGQTLLAVLNSILDMSKIESGKLVLEPKTIALGDVVDAILPVYTIQAEEKGIDFEVFRSSGSKRLHIGDPSRIQQVLHNLLSNAIKFTATGSVTLDVSCRPGRPVVFEIKDTGTGMTDEQANRAFDAFEQAEAGPMRRFGGAGLGLSIVRELVGMMGGKVSLETALGQGTSVRVELPLAEVGAEAQAQAVATSSPISPLTPPSAKVPQRALRVLAADDNATNRDVLLGMLGQAGISLSFAHNGQQALDLWQEAQSQGAGYDVVLLDLAMPVLDGESAMRALRARESQLGMAPCRIIAVSGQALASSSEDTDHVGFDDHLMKPFTQKQLLALLP